MEKQTWVKIRVKSMVSKAVRRDAAILQGLGGITADGSRHFGRHVDRRQVLRHGPGRCEGLKGTM